jgi:hypothetical protein
MWQQAGKPWLRRHPAAGKRISLSIIKFPIQVQQTLNYFFSHHHS